MQYLIAIAIIAIVGMPFWMAANRRRLETARELYFNRQAMPILLLPDHPFDEDFPDRVKAYIQSLQQADNPWQPVIIATPYYAPVGDAQTVNKNFHQYLLLQIEAWQSECERVAAEKFGRLQDDASRKITGYHIARNN